MEFLGTFAHFVTSIMQTFQGDIFKENCEHFWINTIFLVWMSITLHHDPQLIHIFSEGYRRYLALCLTSSVSHLVSAFLFFCDAERRRQTSYDVARLLLMAPIDPWRNSTPAFGAVAFCTTNIEDFRTHLTSMSSTISSTYSSQKRSLSWSSSKRKIMEAIEVDQLKDTNNERLSWVMPH